jgi:hypothetical protein
MLASHGIFSEDATGHIHLTDLAEPLRTDSVVSVRDIVRIVDPPQWTAYSELEHSIVTGNPAFDHVFGHGFFERQDNSDVANDRFAQGMALLAQMEDPAIPALYDFSAFRTVVDVGGGRGGLLAEILRACPDVHGVLFDRAAVVAEPVHIRRLGVTGRCRLEPGDFFDAVPAGGDLYVLKRILHDWPDPRCVSILRNCARAMNPDGRVLVLDAIVSTGNTPDPSKDMDLVMLALLAGKERTEEQFDDLFAQAGLQRTRTIPLPTPVSIIEAQLIR